MTDKNRYTSSELLKYVESILQSVGLNSVQSSGVARAIVAAERDHCKSHGIYRLEGLLRTIKSGKVDPAALPELVPHESSAIVKVDAKCGFSSPAFELGLPVLVQRARDFGIAALMINNCTHFTALWVEAEELAKNGLAGLVLCPSYAAVAPAGGRKPLLGTNPFAFGWPRIGKYPYVFDFATSVAARGEIELHRRAGKPIPEGWAIDSEGNATTDPEKALNGAMLPFGGHKGSALSTMIELLAGIMISDMTSLEVLEYLGTTSFYPRHGELVIAMSVEAFAHKTSNPLAQAEILFDQIVGQGARLPSQRRFTAREKAEAEGILLSDAEIKSLEAFSTLGLLALD